MSPADNLAALPFILLASLTLGMLLVDLIRGNREQSLLWTMSVCIFTAIASLLHLYHAEPAFQGLVRVDSFSAVCSVIILLGTALSLLLSYRQLDAQRASGGIDTDILMLLAACGGLVMVVTSNLIVFFVGFELLSICVYVLTGIARKERASAEAAMKYFILGAFSSAFLLYGMALTYGATGSMDITQIAQTVHGASPLLLAGLGFMLFGFCFKISVVPFHFWAPDVYQGAPTSIAAFMAAVVKTAAFGAFLRIMFVGFASLAGVWEGLLWVLSILTMTIGNLMALRQRSIKRMLAYSSVSHAGYALMGFLALGASGGEAVLFYLLVYTLMTIASFGVVLLVTSGSDAQYDKDDIDSLSGLGWSHPYIGLAMTIALLSLAGMPPLGGFVGKFYLFTAAIQAGHISLVIIAALNSVVSLYYYLAPIVVMYFSGERKVNWNPPRVSLAPGIAVAIASLGIIYLGIFSETCLYYVRLAIHSLETMS